MKERAESHPDGINRRSALGTAAGIVAGLAAPGIALRAFSQSPQAPGHAGQAIIPADATKVPGAASTALGARSQFVSPVLSPTGVITGASFTPLQDLAGTITPSDLHFQRHHNGIALIDPDRFELIVHGMADRARAFSLDELKRFPSVTRVCFVECAGNGRSAFRNPRPEMSPQVVDGLTSNSEWTGVLVSTLLREVGAKRGASWVLAEGGDAAVLSRSVPIAKMLDDAIIAYAQNGEPLRVANGYPVRLLLPGYEGNMNIKWLRRLELTDQPNMSRDETSKYTDPLPGGKARQFSFVMDAKSVITHPSYPEMLPKAGWWPVSGLAWSGRGRITAVDVSTDRGVTWMPAKLSGDALPMAHTRFELMWKWDGRPTTLMSRARDETGYVQPSVAAYRTGRGLGTDYHFNAIRSWSVDGDGRVFFAG